AAPGAARADAAVALGGVRLAPRPALFPYTTLFRSGAVGDDAATVVERERLVRALRRLGPGQRRVVVLRHLLDRSEAEVAAELGTDRKSTRLNSSHVKISYAVFCLKKKKTRPPPRRG